MQVDSVPTLQEGMKRCVRYPMIAAPLRVALRRYFMDPEDVVCVLEVLDQWFSSEEEEGDGEDLPLDEV